MKNKDNETVDQEALDNMAAQTIIDMENNGAKAIMVVGITEDGKMFGGSAIYPGFFPILQRAVFESVISMTHVSEQETFEYGANSSEEDKEAIRTVHNYNIEEINKGGPITLILPIKIDKSETKQ